MERSTLDTQCLTNQKRLPTTLVRHFSFPLLVRTNADVSHRGYRPRAVLPEDGGCGCNWIGFVGESDERLAAQGLLAERKGMARMDETDFIASVLSNAVNHEILARLPVLELSDAWLVAGALFQTAWNRLTDRPADYGIKDSVFSISTLTPRMKPRTMPLRELPLHLPICGALSKCAIKRACISGMARSLACPIRHSSARPTASIAS
jgi:hypothetical protein